MIKLWPLVFALGLGGCASLQDMANVIFGNSSQKITRTPIWVYRPDLLLGIGGKYYSGDAVTVLGNTDIQVWSAVDVDRVEVSTCSRHHVCQIKGGVLACDTRSDSNPGGTFEISQDWFGNPQKYMIYHFIPDKIESNPALCPSVHMTISIYDKNVLAAWGFTLFRSEPKSNFPAAFTCNGVDWHFSGASVCSTKSGELAEIIFPEDVDNFRAEDSCQIQKISSKEFKMKPKEGWCRASFGRGLSYHDVVINGYSEVLVRDGKE